MEMVFDVESNGLHGEGFAVGWVIVDDEGQVIKSGYEACEPRGPIDPWVKENVLPSLPIATQPNVETVRALFWAAWEEAKAGGASQARFIKWVNNHNHSWYVNYCISDQPPKFFSWMG